MLWVDWTGHYVTLGYGPTVGEQLFFAKFFETSSMGAVRFVSLGHKSPDPASYAYFTFRYNQGQSQHSTRTLRQHTVICFSLFVTLYN